MLTDGRTTDGRRTDARVTGILIAHLGAFGSGELKINFDLSPTPLVHQTGWDPGLQTKILFDMFHIYCCSACMQTFSKKY